MKWWLLKQVRSASGRHASYWNAFLFKHLFIHIVLSKPSDYAIFSTKYAGHFIYYPRTRRPMTKSNFFYLIYFLYFVSNSMSKPMKRRYLFKNSDAGAPSWKRVQKFGLVYVPQLKWALPTTEEYLVKICAGMNHGCYFKCFVIKL